MLCRVIVVQPNPKVYKALKDWLDAVLAELKRIENGGAANGYLIDVIRLINTTLDGIKAGEQL